MLTTIGAIPFDLNHNPRQIVKEVEDLFIAVGRQSFEPFAHLIDRKLRTIDYFILGDNLFNQGGYETEILFILADVFGFLGCEKHGVNRWGNHMNHQTLTGTRGLDLYVLTDKGEWRFMASGRPTLDSKDCEQKVIGAMEPKWREYMLYLPLYDGLTKLEIGVDREAVVEAPKVDLPRCDKPIVMYGTSILQGGCANRPGMAHTSILSRRFNREVINLGFSGNALLDLEIAELMASVEDPAIYVFDYVPNAYDYLIREKGEQFFRIVRDAHPDVPILFLEDPYFGHYEYDAGIKAEVDKKNAAQWELFCKLKKQGEKNIWYLKSDDMVGHDNEAFVDGIHFTDLGMMRYADWLAPHIRKHMKK